LKEPSFTIGIEEEYLLVDRKSRDLASDPPAEMLAECQRRVAGQVSPEFLRAQIEVGTTVCQSLSGARAELAHLRRSVAEVAANHGLAPMAAPEDDQP
jgi:glutamate---cysteine ligase / carboxylate-amine ligase